MRKMVCLIAGAVLTACATESTKPAAQPAKTVAPATTAAAAASNGAEFYLSTCKVPAAPPTLIQHAQTVLRDRYLEKLRAGAAR